MMIGVISLMIMVMTSPRQIPCFFSQDKPLLGIILGGAIHAKIEATRGCEQISTPSKSYKTYVLIAAKSKKVETQENVLRHQWQWGWGVRTIPVEILQIFHASRPF